MADNINAPSGNSNEADEAPFASSDPLFRKFEHAAVTTQDNPSLDTWSFFGTDEPVLSFWRSEGVFELRTVLALGGSDLDLNGSGQIAEVYAYKPGGGKYGVNIPVFIATLPEPVAARELFAHDGDILDFLLDKATQALNDDNRVQSNALDSNFSTGAGDDIISAGQGKSEIHVGTGNNIIDGGFGYDQLLLAGAQYDYDITYVQGSVAIRAKDGSGVTIAKNVESITFNDNGAVTRMSLDGDRSAENTRPVTFEAGETLNGTHGSDTLSGGQDDDLIMGGAGNDTLLGGAGNDTIKGGAGDDNIDGGMDANFIDGGAGYDTLMLAGERADYLLDLTTNSAAVVALDGSQQTLANDIEQIYFTGSGEALVLDTQTSNGGTFYAGEEGGYLGGTDGNDVFVGGRGDDTFQGGLGDDRYEGGTRGGDYDQVNLDGWASDYTFTRNEDGSVTAASALWGTDTLNGIEGIWFLGEEMWTPLDELVSVDTGKIFVAAPDGSNITGTDGDDRFEGGSGNDIFAGGKGDDVYLGGGGDYNQVNLDGASSDYVFTRNEDDTVTAVSADWGTDTLQGIDGIWFFGEGKWAPLDELAPTSTGKFLVAEPGGSILNGTNGNDTFQGGVGNDVFIGGKGDDLYLGGGGSYNQVNLDGSSSDYIFSRDEDGTVTAVSADWGTDTLQGIDGVWFFGEGEWSALDDLISSNPGGIFNAEEGGSNLNGTPGDDIFNGGLGNDVLTGGRGNDIYRGGGGDYNQVNLFGAVADYAFTRNGDGTVTMESDIYGTDQLDDIQGLWFYGDQQWVSVDQFVGW